MNWNKGDKIVCTCNGISCPRFFTVMRVSVAENEVFAEDEAGNPDHFSIDYEYLISRELYDSPLYKALR